jgi:hypothetical protein
MCSQRRRSGSSRPSRVCSSASHRAAAGSSCTCAHACGTWRECAPRARRYARPERAGLRARLHSLTCSHTHNTRRRTHVRAHTCHAHTRVVGPGGPCEQKRCTSDAIQHQQKRCTSDAIQHQHKPCSMVCSTLAGQIRLQWSNTPSMVRAALTDLICPTNTSARNSKPYLGQPYWSNFWSNLACY